MEQVQKNFISLTALYLAVRACGKDFTVKPASKIQLLLLHHQYI